MTDTPRAKEAENRPTTMRSLHRGLLAFKLLLECDAIRTIDLAQRMDIDKGLASRILKTLVMTGFAERMPDRRYRASAAVRISSPEHPAAPILSTPGPSIRFKTRPLLHQLVEMTGESVHLGVLADDSVVFIDRAVPSAALVVDRPVGTLVNLYNAAIGKVFLAYFGTAISGLSPNDPQLPSAEELRDILDRGYAIDDEGLFSGVRCCAVPLLQQDGHLAGAISLSGPTARISRERMHQLGALLRETVANFEHRAAHLAYSAEARGEPSSRASV